MSIFSGVAGGLGSAVFIALAFLFVLSIVVFIHELGHFLVARWCGVNVKVFSLGFGREIWGFYDRHGTRWRVAWIPLGGYVKFMDDENGASVPSKEALAGMSESERSGSFHLKPLWQRAAIVAAGPMANFLSAILLFALMHWLVGVPSTEPRVGRVMPNTPAVAAGFQPGDLVVEINGQNISSFNEILRVVSISAERELSFRVDRGGSPVTLLVKPDLREFDDGMGGKYKRGVIGIQQFGEKPEIKKAGGPVEALWIGVKETNYIITSTLHVLGDIVRGRQNADQIGGPIRIAYVAGEVAKRGIEQLVHFVALISVSVGLINLFPIPLLDGGHLLFYAIEAVRGRPLSERTQEIGFKIGFALVMLLAAFAFWNDRLIPGLWIKGS